MIKIVDIHINNLSFRYPGDKQGALNNIKLDIPAGQFVLLAGPSGCGKSTLGLAISSLIPSRVPGKITGEVYLGKQNLSKMELHEASQQVGMVFQNPDNQLINYNVEMEIAFGPENLNLDPEEISRRINQALHFTGADKFRKAPITTLSGGQKQRVAIAAALAMKQKVLVLDEPTSALDPKGTQEVLQVLRRLNKELGMTIILIEHKIDEVIKWVDRVLLMESGHIVVDESTRNAFRNIELWNRLGVSVPEVVQISYALPDAFAGEVALTVEEAADALIGTKYSTALTDSLLTRDRVQRGTPMLKWKDVNLTYDENSVLKGANLDVYENEWVSLVGSNGSGKTSLAALAMGFNAPTAGEIFCCGKPVKYGNISKQAENIGYLFQSADHMLFTDTVEKEIAFGRIYGNRKKCNNTYTELQLAELIDLSNRLKTNPYKLSLGQRQRLALISLLSANPKALILDEPTTGQDEGHARMFLEFLDNIRRSQNLTYLMITHDMRAVAKYTDRVVVLNEGHLILNDRPERVFAQVDRLEDCQVIPPPVAYLHWLLTDKTATEVTLNVSEFLNVISNSKDRRCS